MIDINGETALGRAILATNERFAKLTDEKREELSRKLDITFEEYVAFQNAKSVAQATERIDLDTAMVIYTALGSGPEHFNAQPAGTKAALTYVLAKLLEPR